MKCYACEATRFNTRYRMGREGLCEFNNLDECKEALLKWRKQKRPLRRQGLSTLLVFLYLLLN